jgi:hypothetical protein
MQRHCICEWPSVCYLGNRFLLGRPFVVAESIYLSIYLSMALQPLFWTLAALSVSSSFYTVGRTPWKGDQPIARPLPTHRTTQQNKYKQIFMPQVGFERTIPIFERAKTVHALDRAAIAICRMLNAGQKFNRQTGKAPVSRRLASRAGSPVRVP